jgi:hypothetical protein
MSDMLDAPSSRGKAREAAFSRGHTLATVLSIFLILLAGGCDSVPEVTGPEAPPEPAFDMSNGGPTAIASGGGRFFDSWFLGSEWQFAFTAQQREPSGAADGRFRFVASFGGDAIELHGRVTCMMADPATNRAWIGGVITLNRSEQPFFRDDPLFRVGEPQWFRVVDNGEGSTADEPDRTTRLFWRGSGGFQDEWAFCASGFWPVVDGVERFTDPLIQGNIQVHVRD